MRTQDGALQATTTYANLLTFLANLQTLHPNVALMSASVDPKAGGSGRAQVGPTTSAEVQASIRLRAYWAAEPVDASRSP